MNLGEGPGFDTLPTCYRPAHCPSKCWCLTLLSNSWNTFATGDTEVFEADFDAANTALELSKLMVWMPSLDAKYGEPRPGREQILNTLALENADGKQPLGQSAASRSKEDLDITVTTAEDDGKDSMLCTKDMHQSQIRRSSFHSVLATAAGCSDRGRCSGTRGVAIWH